MYGAKKCLVSNYPSSKGTGDGIISFSFPFLLRVHFPHVVSEGPGRPTIDFMDVLAKWTGTFSTNRGAYCCGGTYPIVSPMIGVGDAVKTSDSKDEVALEIEINML